MSDAYSKSCRKSLSNIGTLFSVDHGRTIEFQHHGDNVVLWGQVYKLSHRG